MALRSCSRCGSAHPAGQRCPLAPSGRAAGSPSTRAQRDGTGDYERNRRLLLGLDQRPVPWIRCAYCPERATTADHVIAVADGGSNDLANLRPSCRPCNLSRGARLGNQRRRQR